MRFLRRTGVVELLILLRCFAADPLGPGFYRLLNSVFEETDYAAKAGSKSIGKSANSFIAASSSSETELHRATNCSAHS
jgi:hypothetical protein